MDKLYAGIDLHANNSVVVVLDEQDQGGTANGYRMSWNRFFWASCLFAPNSRAWSSSPPTTGIGSSMDSWRQAIMST